MISSEKIKKGQVELGSQFVRTFHPIWNDGTAGTWQGWAKNSSNLLMGNANITLGTASVPNATNMIDSNGFIIENSKSLSEVVFFADNGFSTKTYEIFIESADYVDGGALAPVTNRQTLVHQTFTIGGANNYTRKSFTIATHMLNSKSIIKMSFRFVSGSSYILQAPQMIFKFD